MLVQQKIGTIVSFELKGRSIDLLSLAWHETNKRILHKTTAAGIAITFKFLKEGPAFSQGDVVLESNDYLVVIDILPVDSIIVRPGSMLQMAALCYEIGNRHLPLFVDGHEVLIPFEGPLFRWLNATGFETSRGSRKLLCPLKTTTMAHPHVTNTNSLFSKILKFTKNTPDE